MPSVFIAYAHDDRELAGQIVRALRAEGFEAWWDEEAPGVDWVKALESQIAQIGAVVVVWTAASVDDPTVKEVARLALSGQKLVNAVIAATAPPFPFGSVGTAALDGWAGEEANPGWVRLAAAVRERTGGAIAGPSPPAKPRLETVGGNPAQSAEPKADSTAGDDGPANSPGATRPEALKPPAEAVRLPASGARPWLIVRRVAAVFLVGWAVVMVLGILRLVPSITDNDVIAHWSGALLIPFGMFAIASFLWKEKY